ILGIRIGGKARVRCERAARPFPNLSHGKTWRRVLPFGFRRQPPARPRAKRFRLECVDVPHRLAARKRTPRIESPFMPLAVATAPVPRMQRAVFLAPAPAIA